MSLHVDVLVIGAGIGGLSAAIRARQAGMHVLVITKAEEIWECNTHYAQGGIIAWNGNDNPELLARDIY
ncbi:MAG TPA: FAD-binding protein, partial [Termitinemataceae bacterium]|nr:FAD-binding protein [Termitinemataceae bacterium]HOM24078.1 FAD-binding protein [Termitinemataceae bacterium]HPQ01361.1 FAD-binding protein [Termitinemataceae bacterium]